VEPFVGGGAMFFYLAQHFPIREFVIVDRNEAIVLAYQTIRDEVAGLIEQLQAMAERYRQLTPEQQAPYYYAIRSQFNAPHLGNVQKTAELIFLNRTCYNGLFRVNAKGAFNVPFGRYVNPTICDVANLTAVSSILQQAEIFYGDFAACRDWVDARTFVYFDPPYRPVSRTASFNSYARDAFDDSSQRRLAAFFHDLNQVGARLMLSNSDPHNEDPDDDFFESLYPDFYIHKVLAKRVINSNGAKRGEMTELLITNY
jgi:DNA adenine methylase